MNQKITLWTTDWEEEISTQADVLSGRSRTADFCCLLTKPVKTQENGNDNCCRNTERKTAPIHWQTGGDERGKARNDLEKRGWHHIVIPTSFERSECRYDFQNPDRSTPRRTRAMPARIQGRKMTGSRSSPLWFS